MKKNVCPNCSFENPQYAYLCKECGYFLRERVYNINLWETISNLIDSPFQTFQKIIFSEHKNFIIPLTFFIALKYFIISRFVSLPFIDTAEVTVSWFVSLLIVLAGIILLFSVITYGLNIFYRTKNLQFRFRDTYSLLVYANIPLILSLLILFPAELVLFGKSLFSNNPYPFQINPLTAYIFLGIEALVFIWSLFLFWTGFYVQTSSKGYSWLLTFKMFFWLSLFFYLNSQFIFTL